MQSGYREFEFDNFYTGVNAVTASTLTRTASTTTNWMHSGSLQDGYWVTATSCVKYCSTIVWPLSCWALIHSIFFYRPIEINSTVSPTTGGFFTATHTHVAASTDLSPANSDQVGPTWCVRHNSFWTLTKTSGLVGAGTPYSIQGGGTGLGTVQELTILGLFNGRRSWNDLFANWREPSLVHL